MKLSNIVKILHIGAIALVMTGCGGDSTSSEPITSTEIIEEDLRGANGNRVLQSGKTYTAVDGETFNLHINQNGNLMFAVTECEFKLYDINYNPYDLNIAGYSTNNIYNHSYSLAAGDYYVNVVNCRYTGSISLQSNVVD